MIERRDERGFDIPARRTTITVKKNKMKRFTLFLATAMACTTAFAQIPGHDIPPRRDDHFQRNLVVNRIDMNEKINQPLVASQSTSLYSDPVYPETNGLIVALLNGFKSGKYLAYDPDSLNKPLTYTEALDRIQALNGENIDTWGEEEIIDEEPWMDGEEWLEEDNSDGEGDIFLGEEDVYGTAASSGEGDFEVAPFESVVEFIEGRIFDKNRSATVHDIQFIRMVWVDPNESMPDRNMLCFKFSEVLETLEQTQWTNKFNEAEHRNMREIFEERIFNSFVTNLSDRGVRTLEEAAFRQNQMLDFEHNLWSY